MWKKILVWAIVIGVLATLINDTGRYFTGWQTADAAADVAASAAAVVARKDHNRNRAWVEVYNQAAAAGAVAENVELDEERARVWVRVDVTGTWALGPIIQMSAGNFDTDTWWKTPIPIRSNSQALY